MYLGTDDEFGKTTLSGVDLFIKVEYSAFKIDRILYHRKKMRPQHILSGGFRSEEGAKNHMIIASVIATIKKQNKNVFKMIKDTFDGSPPKMDCNGVPLKGVHHWWKPPKAIISAI